VNSQGRGPAWWELGLLLPLMVVLLEVEAGAPLSELGHTVAVFGTLALLYGLVGVWLWGNRLALTRANDLVGLLRGSREGVVRECSPEHPLQTTPLETGTGRKGNGDRDPGQVVERVFGSVEKEER
jgi:hypothetical protein